MRQHFFRLMHNSKHKKIQVYSQVVHRNDDSVCLWARNSVTHTHIYGECATQRPTDESMTTSQLIN